jgi:hypothetical protein
VDDRVVGLLPAYEQLDELGVSGVRDPVECIIVYLILGLDEVEATRLQENGNGKHDRIASVMAGESSLEMNM